MKNIFLIFFFVCSIQSVAMEEKEETQVPFGNFCRELQEKILKNLCPKDLYHLLFVSKETHKNVRYTVYVLLTRDSVRWKNNITSLKLLSDYHKELTEIRNSPEHIVLEDRKREVQKYLGNRSAMTRMEFLDREIKQLQEKNPKLLATASLERLNLSGAKIESAILLFANLEFTDFSEANLKEANLTNANMSQTLFFSTNLEWAKFIFSNLSRAVFHSTSFVGEEDFSGADLTNAYFENCTFSNTFSLKSADLSGATFENVFCIDFSEELEGHLVTLDFLRERGAQWDENNPPKISGTLKTLDDWLNLNDNFDSESCYHGRPQKWSPITE